MKIPTRARADQAKTVRFLERRKVALNVDRVKNGVLQITRGKARVGQIAVADVKRAQQNRPLAKK